MKFSMLFMTLIFATLCCSQASLTKYDSPNGYWFSFDVNEWEIRENENQTFLFNREDLKQKSAFNTNLNIIVQDLTSVPISLDEYHKNTLKQIEQVLGKNAVKSEKQIKISDYIGKEIIYIMQKDIANKRMVSLKLRQIYFIEKNRAYLITYTSTLNQFDKYLLSAEKIFETFSLK